MQIWQKEVVNTAYLVCLDAERQLQRTRIVLQDPAQRIVVLWIDPLNIPIVDGLAKKLPVKTPREVGIQQTTVVDGLADDATHELEERQVLGVDIGCTVRLVREPVCSARLEQRIVGVKHLASEYLEPFAGDTASVDTLFVVESDAKFAVLDLLAGLTLQVLEAVFEDTRAAHIQLKCRVVLPRMWSSVKLLAEVVPLVVKVEYSRIVHEKRERSTHQRWIVADHEVENLSVRVRENDEQLLHGLRGGG